MTNRCDDLAGVVHRSDKGQDLLVLAHPVRSRDPSWNYDGVEILRLQVGRFHVDFARIGVLGTIDPLLVPREDDLGTLLDQTIVRNPQFEVLVAVFGEHDDMPSAKSHEGGKACRRKMPCVPSDADRRRVIPTTGSRSGVRGSACRPLTGPILANGRRRAPSRRPYANRRGPSGPPRPRPRVLPRR